MQPGAEPAPPAETPALPGARDILTAAQAAHRIARSLKAAGVDTVDLTRPHPGAWGWKIRASHFEVTKAKGKSVHQHYGTFEVSKDGAAISLTDASAAPVPWGP